MQLETELAIHDRDCEIERLRKALKEMLEAFSMENIGLDASKRRLAAKEMARQALSQ